MINRSSNKARKKAGLRLIAVGLALIALVVFADARIRAVIQKAGAYQCQIAASRIINNAVIEEISSYDYGALVILTYGEAGAISSIQSDMASVNRLKARVTQLVNAEMNAIEKTDLNIPIGTISGLNLLYGRGPSIPVKLSPKGYAGVNLISKFTSAGVNQTLHQITMTVTADISAIVPGYTTSVEVNTEFIIAETVIVGYVPESFTHVVL